MKIFLPGLYPRDEELIRATKEFERGRINEQAVIDLQNKNTARFLSLQQGFEYVSQGYFHWQDLIRPFNELIEKAGLSALKRFYETNIFWRVIEISGEPTLSSVSLKDWIEKYFLYSALSGNKRKFIYNLPFIYLFQEFSQGLSLPFIMNLLLKVIEELSKNPLGVICFYEPSFGFKKLSTEEKNIGMNFIAKIREITSLPLFLWSSFYPLKEDKEFYFKLPVDGLGIDFYANSFEEILPYFPKNKILLAGVIHTESTRKDNYADLFFLKEKLAHSGLSLQQIFWTTNAPSELLPREQMDKKVLYVQDFLNDKNYRP